MQKEKMSQLKIHAKRKHVTTKHTCIKKNSL